jgi:hypothetical protein
MASGNTVTAWQYSTAEQEVWQFTTWMMQQEAEADSRWHEALASSFTASTTNKRWQMVSDAHHESVRQKEAMRIMQTPYVMSMFMIPDSDDDDDDEEHNADDDNNNNNNETEQQADDDNEQQQQEEDGGSLFDALHQMQIGLMACGKRIRTASMSDDWLQKRERDGSDADGA